MRLRFVLALFLLVPAFGWAKEVRLFNEYGRTVPDYEVFISKAYLKAGDDLVFSDGRVFRYEEFLGGGNSSRILKVREVLEAGALGEELVLRLPLRSRATQRNLGLRADLRAFLTSTVEGYPALVRNGVRVPRIVYASPRQYLAVEYVPFDFDGVQFFREPERIDPLVLEHALEALEKFAASTAPFAKIGDFRAEQIVYSEVRREWVLLDWTRFHLEALSARADPVFGKEFETSLERRGPSSDRQKSILRRLRERIRERRREILPSFCRRLLDFFRPAASAS